MLLRLFLFASIFYSAWATCPTGFELVRKGECYQQVRAFDDIYAPNAPSTIKQICADLGALPVIIKNQEDHDYWASIAREDHKQGNNNGFVFLGIECLDQYPYNYQWMDGSAIDFKPAGTDSAIDSSCNQNGQYCMWYIKPDTGSWTKACNMYAFADEYCVVPPVKSTFQPDESCTEFSYDDVDNVCYQVGASPANWTEANSVCKGFGASVVSVHSEQENWFVRRLAVSKGLVNGLLLGATYKSKKNTFKWADGSAWDYENFAPGFPIDGLGDCLAMESNDQTGPWINLDCSTELPFACSRKPGYTHSLECDGTLHEEGDIIVSPGFPTNASIPCDFILKVDPGKLVQVEILSLEANSCCDKLVLSEGTLGGAVIADLTGDLNGKQTLYNTTSQNIMRASWQPKGGINVKGMMITFRAIPK